MLSPDAVAFTERGLLSFPLAHDHADTARDEMTLLLAFVRIGMFNLDCLECPHQIELWLAARRSRPLTDRPTARGWHRRRLVCPEDRASWGLSAACRRQCRCRRSRASAEI